MYRNILIPVDMAHTEKAPEMIKAAKKLATDDSQFFLANIIHSVPAVAEMSLPPEYFETAQEEATKALSAVASGQDIGASIVIRVGQPGSDILQIQKDKEIDLIIIGSHKPGLQDYFLGSTASRVVRHAQCPVLVMR